MDGGRKRPGHQHSRAMRAGPRAEHGLDDHGLQQAEARHEVQRDGRLQVVSVQPQVAEVWHVLQIRGEIVEGGQVVRANLGPVDLCGETRGEVSRRRGQGQDRGAAGKEEGGEGGRLRVRTPVLAETCWLWECVTVGEWTLPSRSGLLMIKLSWN